MTKDTASLPVLLDEPELCCYMCAHTLSMLGLVGVEILPKMWSASALCNRSYRQTLISRAVCLDCFGFQAWPATLAYMVYFTNRRQIFLREKDSHFVTEWNKARFAYEERAAAHQKYWTNRRRAKRAQQAQGNESLRIKLLRRMVDDGSESIEFLDEN